jgi:hypothetical protein
MLLLLQCSETDDPAAEDRAETTGSVAGEDTFDESGGECLYKITTLDSLDVVSENIGFTGADLLSLFEGTRLHLARYATENEINEQSPLGGDTILALSVEHDEGEIRDIVGKEPSCGNYLEIDVVVAVRTSDMAFAEEASGILYFYRNEVENIFTTHLYADLDADDLEGDFEIQDFIEPSSAENVLLYLDETIDEKGTLQGSVIVMTSEAGHEVDASDYVKYVLSWKTSIFI